MIKNERLYGFEWNSYKLCTGEALSQYVYKKICSVRLIRYTEKLLSPASYHFILRTRHSLRPPLLKHLQSFLFLM
jgi:hypothetical protein